MDQGNGVTNEPTPLPRPCLQREVGDKRCNSVLRLVLRIQNQDSVKVEMPWFDI